MEEYTCKKSTCEKYDIRFNRGEWAFITIDESTGLFQAHSSFGDYNYSWPYHGRKSFKHFILELADDPSYFLGKVAKDDYFYDDETKENWKKKIIEDRRENYLNKEQARELWNIVEEIEYYSAESCQRELCDNSIVNELYCEPWYNFEVVTGCSPQACFFAKK
ncbi:hypothetical protein FDC50_15020 [Clostridium botulinum]|nr:hypothetical protein KU41_15400 [Clostridium botulinum]MBY6802817.1 hypothetical protein [Clostridium botulinum]MBY6812936.1 hypothetical protein [Clostridium botulinum]MBY6818937.1 hypothetical protein [Clostridium botulinum]NFJ49563.1 hypothetical protein [Clostridium botulinum]